MLGRNLKVHFAGSDGEEHFSAALKAAEANYRLYSCYKFIAKKKPGDDFRLPENHVIRVEDVELKHVIQDSGLYTLMFGAQKNQKQTVETLTQWQDKLIAFVKQNKLKASCVEIDCQKVLGVKEAWYFRERMRKLLPENRQINVFHLEDGKKGLDSLIDFSDYLAIGVPELRLGRPKDFKQCAYQLAYYIKNRKPEIDIHLLGCTDSEVIRECNFCTSSDSTTWLQGVRYGKISDGVKTGHIRNLKRELVEERSKKVKAILDSRGVHLKPKTLIYTANASICATISKGWYEATAGPQD